MVISTSCELLEEQSGLTPQALQQVQRIDRAGAEMKGLAETFLLLARAEHGLPGACKQDSLRAVTDELVCIWREQIEAKGLAFVYTVGAQPSVLFDEVFLRTVLTNLLRNALHYTMSGSIRLELNASGFVVSDTGPGISSDGSKAAFQSFVRQTDVEEGSGVGLSLVRRICLLQGWQIGLTSVEPQGCRFEISLLPQ